MTPFDRFRQHVAEQPDAVAVITPYRTATYRKMWSRIERSTARLQGEWGIVPGDLIAYLGCGHLDALVMYLAAARCGARILPLEHAGLQRAAPSILAATGAVLVLQDDALSASDIAPASSPAAARLDLGVPSRPLSTLIATVCRHPDVAVEDSSVTSLLQWPAHAEGNDAGVPAVGRLQSRSIDALAAQGGMEHPATIGTAAAPRTIEGALFDIDRFGPLVLATLLEGKTLRFGMV